LKRKHSAPDDERRKEHKQARKSENGHSRSHHEQDSMMKVIFRPIKDSLKRVQLATKDRIKSQKERANVMKVELVTIGNFIESLSQEDGKELRDNFW